MNGLEGKRCFVTGGAHGIGRAVVTALFNSGASVAFCDNDPKNGNDLWCELPGVLFFDVDVRDSGSLENSLKEAEEKLGGPLDIIVNNVGIGGFVALADSTIEQFDNVMNTNLRPVFITSRHMALARKGSNESYYGRIINISSTRWLQSEPGTEGYAASKGGIVSLTHALALSLSGTGITVNCISPGWIDNGTFGEISDRDKSQHPSGRVGEPADIARTCLFLADPANDFINGQNIVVDGGMTKKMIYVE